MTTSKVFVTTVVTLLLAAGCGSSPPPETLETSSAWMLSDGGWWASVTPLAPSTDAPASTSSSDGVSLASDLLFAFGSADLTPIARTVLADLAQNMTARGVTVRIKGFTDTVGSDQVNRSLSRRRAQAVADTMVAEGFPKERIGSVEGLGSSHPKAVPADIPSNRALNRRVELEILSGPAIAGPPPDDDGRG